MKKLIFWNIVFIGFFWLLLKPIMVIILSTILFFVFFYCLWKSIKEYKEQKRVRKSIDQAMQEFIKRKDDAVHGAIFFAALEVITSFEYNYSIYRAQGYLFYYKYTPTFIGDNLISDIADTLRNHGYENALGNSIGL